MIFSSFDLTDVLGIISLTFVVGFVAAKMCLKSSLVALAAFFHKESASLWSLSSFMFVLLGYNERFGLKAVDFELLKELTSNLVFIIDISSISFPNFAADGKLQSLFKKGWAYIIWLPDSISSEKDVFFASRIFCSKSLFACIFYNGCVCAETSWCLRLKFDWGTLSYDF